MTELIQYYLEKCLTKRLQVDDGTYKRKGPGRKRQNKELTSEGILDFLRDHLTSEFISLIKNPKSKKRKDAAITGFFRIIKKSCFVLLQRVGPKNLYKRKSVEEFTRSFAESCVAFLCSLNKASELSLVKSFIEYSVIYFPVDKCARVIDNFDVATQEETDFLEAQKINLQRRKFSDKGNIKRWAETSIVFNELLKLSLNVLFELRSSYKRNDVLKHLCKVAKEFV